MLETRERSTDLAASDTSGAWRIAVVSGSVLALELAFIRQIPAEVRAISYFTNLIFMASFFGLGVGCLRERARSLSFLLPLGLTATMLFVYSTRGLVVYDAAEAVHYWLSHDTPAGVARTVPLFAAAFCAFAGCALPFVALGQRLARLLDTQARLRGYGWDILGSLAGTLVFVAASALRMPPWLWPLVLMVLLSATVLERWSERLIHIAAGALFLVFASSPHPATWSPYYLIQHEQEHDGVRVWVNSSFHQFAVNLDPRRSDLGPLRAQVEHKFGIPYEVYRANHAGASPQRVLILGAGTGNDVNIALRNGAASVVAVEIDPAILELGRRYNPTRPYDDRRVRAVVDDARHYLSSSQERFDMVVFGTLDSQTLLSSQANLRLENYVYTQEAFRDVGKLLAPTGIVAAYYSIFKPWLVGRLYRTICDNFPERCRVTHLDKFLFNTIFIAGPGLPVEASPVLARVAQDSRPSSDDWPFLYLEEPTIAPVYWQLIAAVLGLIALVFLGLRRQGESARYVHFLLLGMGFTLMESAAVVRLALLFGSTWIVNAVVFAAVLLTVYLGNLSVMRGSAPSLRAALLGMLASVLFNYLLTPSALLGVDLGLRVAACVVLIGTPVFFAAVCFSRLFATQASSGPALGMNLIGAMAGGLVEYSSMLLGMRAVWLVVLIVYLGAALFIVRAPAAAMTPRLSPAE